MCGYCKIAIDGYNAGMNTTLAKTIRDEIRARRGALKELSERTGVPYSTLVKIGQGYIRNPHLATAEALMRDFGIVCAVPEDK